MVRRFRAGRLGGDQRVTLPHQVQPGGQAAVQLELSAPDRPGSYTLRIDLVQENFAWFSALGAEEGNSDRCPLTGTYSSNSGGALDTGLWLFKIPGVVLIQAQVFPLKTALIFSLSTRLRWS